jgi:hypothetical protein
VRGPKHVVRHCNTPVLTGEQALGVVQPPLATSMYSESLTCVPQAVPWPLVDRRGEPAVVIMSVQDFIRTAAPPPNWLEKAWTGAKRRGLDTLTPAEIDAEITAHRREPDPITPGGVK